jgi:hypothetical protein
MDNLRLFLSRILPWPLDGSYVNIHWTFQGAGFDRPAWSGRACTTVDECVRTVEWVQRMPDTRDFYVCVSTQSACIEEVAKKSGRTVRKAVRSQQNATGVRSLFIDVDVKGGKHKTGYEDGAEAGRAVVKFCVDAGIPRPTLFVSTGSGGLHLYWTLERALPVPEWQPLANALAEATRRFGLQADTGVTVDAARVMRLPETKHSHTGKLATMSVPHMLQHDYTVDQMRSALAPYMGAQVIPLTPRGNNAPTGANADLAGGIETPKAPPVAARSMADAGCGFVRRALDTGGADYANPLWNLTTLVATFTEGGRADAHAMAKGHPTYVPQETDDLYDRKLRERDEKNLGWPSCQSVENAGCVECRTCPLKGPGTRPLQFGRPTPAVPLAPMAGAGAGGSGQGLELPPRYVRSPSGLVQHIVINPKTGASSLVDVVGCPIENGWMQDNPWTIHFTATVGHRKTQVSVTTAQANSSEGFAKEMGHYGIPLNGDTSKLFREFIVAWQTKLQQIKDAVVSSAPFGWSEPAGEINGFAYGGRVWQKNGDKPASNPDPEVIKQFTPQGDLEVWREAARMITDLRTPERDAFLAASFGAPLVRLIGLRGLLIAAFSTDSGAFKSTSMAVAQAIWGNPQTAMQQLDDTQNGVFKKLGQLQALPMLWDELQSNEDTQKFVNLTFRMSGGKEKTRMSSDTSLRQSGLWQTLLMSASNVSVLDYIARANKTTTAGIYRVFEYEMQPIPSTKSMVAAQQQVAKLNSHFGQAGLVYAKFLGSNYDTIEKDVTALFDKLENKLNIRKEERFWVGSIVALYWGAVYANRLELTDIDLPALLKFLIATLQRMRGEVSQKPVNMTGTSAIGSVVMQFLRERQTKHMLRTNKMHTQRGKPPANSIKVTGDTSKLDGIQIHFADESKLMRVASSPFRDWAHENSYSPHTLIGALKREFGVKEIQGRLGGGTPYVSMVEYVLEFDLNNPALAAILEY